MGAVASGISGLSVSTSAASMRVIVGECQLVLATVLFGVSFVGQKQAMEALDYPLTYNACKHL
jgi:hypothetical protein